MTVKQWKIRCRADNHFTTTLAMLYTITCTETSTHSINQWTIPNPSYSTAKIKQHQFLGQFQLTSALGIPFLLPWSYSWWHILLFVKPVEKRLNVMSMVYPGCVSRAWTTVPFTASSGHTFYTQTVIKRKHTTKEEKKQDKSWPACLIWFLYQYIYFFNIKKIMFWNWSSSRSSMLVCSLPRKSKKRLTCDT